MGKYKKRKTFRQDLQDEQDITKNSFFKDPVNPVILSKKCFVFLRFGIL
jgi:hypothetical protein